MRGSAPSRRSDRRSSATGRGRSCRGQTYASRRRSTMDRRAGVTIHAHTVRPELVEGLRALSWSVGLHRRWYVIVQRCVRGYPGNHLEIGGTLRHRRRQTRGVTRLRRLRAVGRGPSTSSGWTEEGAEPRRNVWFGDATTSCPADVGTSAARRPRRRGVIRRARPGARPGALTRPPVRPSAQSTSPCASRRTRPPAPSHVTGRRERI